MSTHLQQATLRQNFKRAYRGKNRDAHFTSLTSRDVAALTATQILKLIAYTKTPAFQNLEPVDQYGLRENLKSGMLRNEHLRAWYDSQVADARAMAEVQVKHVWQGSRDQLHDRMDEAFDHLDREEELQDFFTVMMLLRETVGDRFRMAGLRPLRNWRSDRFKQGLYPRPRSLCREFRLFGEDKPALRAFSVRVKHAIHYLPDYVRDFLNDNGYMFRLAKRLGHIDPDYAQREVSYARGATYEQSASGVHVNDSYQIDLPEYKILRKDHDQFEHVSAHYDFEDLAVTVAHEAAHGIVKALGYIANSDPAVIKAYQADLENMSQAFNFENDFARPYAYFLPIAYGGVHPRIGVAREEALVEVMAELMLRKAGMLHGELYLYFSETTNVALKILETLEADHKVIPGGVSFPDLDALEKYTKQSFVPENTYRKYRFGA